jgi:hypothetical protein
MGIIEFLLIAVLHTDRSASHGHELLMARFEILNDCQAVGKVIKEKDKRNSYSCIPVAPLDPRGRAAHRLPF